jgi:hypothetical protein
MEVPQKTKIRSTIDSWAYIPIYKRDTCTPMFIIALFIIAEIWKWPRCPSSGEWIKKMWYIYTMEYYSVIKINEIMLF